MRRSISILGSWAFVVSVVVSGCAGQQAIWPGTGALVAQDAEEALSFGQELAEAGLRTQALGFFHQAALTGVDEQRHAAYVELYLLGVHHYDELRGERCQILDLSLGCGQALVGCANEAGDMGEKGSESYVHLAIGTDPEELVFPFQQILTSDVNRLPLQMTRQCFLDRCEEEAFEALFSGPQCLALESVEEEVAYCLDEGLPDERAEQGDEQGEEVDDEELRATCGARACELGHDAVYDELIEWPELREEAAKVVDEVCAECVDRDVMQCKIVFARACTGQLAAVCEHEGVDAEALGAHRFELADGREVLVFEMRIEMPEVE